ncbi:hypothetical protein GCM10009836_41930 [Pseudonocardia ailaonensis]|uniref:DUF35 domain-containing protein n=1 Tax=Pseudonocardia ailaonensis TaxID=367279 RepID=A0ABN2N8A2_9PSEU
MPTLTPAGQYRGPAPVVHPESEPFWRGLGEGRLELQKCNSCGTVRWPIAPVCWNCTSLDATWTPVATSGTVSAAVTVRRATGNQVWADVVPFVSAMVDMADGLRLPGRILPAASPSVAAPGSAGAASGSGPVSGSGTASEPGPGSRSGTAAGTAADPAAAFPAGTPVEAAYLDAGDGIGVLCFVPAESA